MEQTLGVFLWGSSSFSTYRLAYILTCSAVWPFIHMQADYYITKNEGFGTFQGEGIQKTY